MGASDGSSLILGRLRGDSEGGSRIEAWSDVERSAITRFSSLTPPLEAVQM